MVPVCVWVNVFWKLFVLCAAVHYLFTQAFTKQKQNCFILLEDLLLFWLS